MDKIYLAIWENSMGNEHKAFKTKEAAQRQLRSWIGEYITDVLCNDGIEQAKTVLEAVEPFDDIDDPYFTINFEGDIDELYVKEVEFEDK